jgi:hypothetical protein
VRVPRAASKRHRGFAELELILARARFRRDFVSIQIRVAIDHANEVWAAETPASLIFFAIASYVPPAVFTHLMDEFRAKIEEREEVHHGSFETSPALSPARLTIRTRIVDEIITIGKASDFRPPDFACAETFINNINKRGRG